MEEGNSTGLKEQSTRIRHLIKYISIHKQDSRVSKNKPEQDMTLA